MPAASPHPQIPQKLEGDDETLRWAPFPVPSEVKTQQVLPGSQQDCQVTPGIGTGSVLLCGLHSGLQCDRFEASMQSSASRFRWAKCRNLEPLHLAVVPGTHPVSGSSGDYFIGGSSSFGPPLVVSLWGPQSIPGHPAFLLLSSKKRKSGP